jgi:RNA polymerase sigma-70 factor, ECF subfamily
VTANPSDPPAARVSDSKDWHTLMQEIQRGNQDALARLYDEASPLVFTVALRILENRADAEEVTLDVFTQLWKNSSKWDSARGSVPSWLVLLARSRSLDRLRWRKSRATPDIVVETAAVVKTPEELSGDSQRSSRIRSALAVLSIEQREALELAFYAGLTQQEIASRLDEPLGTIKSRIRTALLKLKEAGIA